MNKIRTIKNNNIFISFVALVVFVLAIVSNRENLITYSAFFILFCGFLTFKNKKYYHQKIQDQQQQDFKTKNPKIQNLFFLAFGCLTFIWLVLFTPYKYLNTHWPIGIHLEALIYSIVAVLFGKTPLVDFVPQYGLYGLFLYPIFKFVHFTPYSVSICFITLKFLSVILVQLSFFKLVKQFHIRLLFVVCIYFIVLVRNHLIQDLYFQYFPIRFLFPAIGLYLFLSLVEFEPKKIKLKHFSTSIILSIGIFWNLDSGIVTFIAVFLYFIFYYFFEYLRNKDFTNLKSLALMWGLGFLIVFTTINIYFFTKSYHHGFSWYNFIIMQISGVKILKLRIRLFEHPIWIISIFIMIFSFTVTVKQIIQGTKAKLTQALFFVFILSVGILTYYVSRSHVYVFALVLWVILLLAFLLLAFLLQNYPNYKKLIYLFIISFLTTCVATNRVLVFSDWNNFLKRDLYPNHQLEFEENLAFIKKNIQRKESALIIMLNQSFYVYELGFIPNLGIIENTGFVERMLMKNKRIDNENIQEFFIANNILADGLAQSTDFNFTSYTLVDENKNGIKYYRRK